MYDHEIRLARQFMHGHLSTGNCCSCGGELIDPFPLRKVLKTNFTTIEPFIRAPGDMVCAGCRKLLDTKSLRFNSVLYLKPGNLTTVKADAAVTPTYLHDLLLHPPDQFVVSLAYSHQKHHWLYAGLSTPEGVLFGTDNRTVVYDPVANRPVLEAIDTLIAHGVGVTQILTGNYHPATAAKVGAAWLSNYDSIIAPHRPSGLVELLLKIAPRPEKSEIILQEESIMIDPLDRQAAEYVAEIARWSNYRREHGKEFWDGYFLYRVNRVSRQSLSIATDKLIGMLNIPSTAAGEHIIPLLDSLTNDQTAQIETALRERAKLIISLAYSILKESRSK